MKCALATKVFCDIYSRHPNLVYLLNSKISSSFVYAGPFPEHHTGDFLLTLTLTIICNPADNGDVVTKFTTEV